jgi:hypothetical protein
VRRFARELEDCQREGRLAFSEAEYWLAQIRLQTKLLAAAQQQVSSSEQALSAAHARVAVARASGPPGVVATAASEPAAAPAGAGLALARQQEQAAAKALAQAAGELAVWQARGRRAWEEAEAAAERATGTLAPLLIVPPPLAGLPVPVLSPIPAFAIPPGLEPADCGAQDGTTLASREATKAQLQRLAAQFATTWPALAAVLAAAAREIEQELEDEAGSAVIDEGAGAAEGAATATEGALGATRLSPAEQATLSRLKGLPSSEGLTFSDSEHIGAEVVDNVPFIRLHGKPGGLGLF